MDGDAILLVGKDQMCVCFLSPQPANVTAAHNTSTINSTGDKPFTLTSDNITMNTENITGKIESLNEKSEAKIIDLEAKENEI